MPKVLNDSMTQSLNDSILLPIYGGASLNTAPILPLLALWTQTRHPARIFTVDIREMLALNSLRRVSISTKALFPCGARGCASFDSSLRTRNAPGARYE